MPNSDCSSRQIHYHSVYLAKHNAMGISLTCQLSQPATGTSWLVGNVGNMGITATTGNHVVGNMNQVELCKQCQQNPIDIHLESHSQHLNYTSTEWLKPLPAAPYVNANIDFLERFKAAAEGTNLGVWDVQFERVVDEQVDYTSLFFTSTKTFFSESFLSCLGLENKNIGDWQHIKRLLHPDDLPLFESFLTNHIEFEMPLLFECRIHCRGLDYQWFEIKGNTVRDEIGRPIRMTGSIQNCTAQKEMLLSVLESEEAKKMALEAAKIGVWTGNLLDSTWTWDARVDAIFEFTEQERGDLQAWKARLHPDDADNVINALNESLDHAIPFEVEYRIITPTNKTKYIVAKGQVSQNVFGDLVRIDCILYDNTVAVIAKTKLEEITSELEERVKQRTKELEASRDLAEVGSRTKSRFLAMMSHEIRTPMNGVIGALDLVEQSNLNIEQQELISTAKNSALNLVAILNDILDLNKIEAGKLKLETVDMSIAELVDGVVGVFAPIAEAKQVELILHESFEYQDLVSSDPTRIRQVLSNLVGNAVKFTQSNDEKIGKIILKISKDHQQSLGPLQMVNFEVMDNGIGIAPEAVDNLFSAFTQAEDSTTRKYGGTGLGLAICARLSDLLGGTIAVESEPGQGSCFRLSLPLWPAKEEAPLSPLFGESICLINFAEPALHWVIEQLENEGAMVDRLSLDDLTKQDNQHLLQDASSILFFAATVPQADLTLLLHSLDDDLRSKLTLWLSKQQKQYLFDSELTFKQVMFPPFSSYKLKRWGLVSEEILPKANNTFVVNDVKPIQSTSSQANVLIVEDNPLNQKLILKQMERLGFLADLAPNGEIGLQMFKDKPYQVVISDCHMPEMDGYLMTQAIRQYEAQQELDATPIVALTGAAMTGDKEKCLQAGMNDFLTKPIQTCELKVVLEKWYGAK
ncbi:hypothetical protein C2869_19265 [Saccharobesus litoralis]|uniref:histidine kinase n=1 Tax=Saccharobesus litoralis TaxID=2172099 RepID=A0A2S0VW57_9ALTE|nr:ATP-binding protein [Saccharobesus litoralis]AWB68413.1 hypothetical protein C2869_19265 [Saccharobesus litoralis]